MCGYFRELQEYSMDRKKYLPWDSRGGCSRETIRDLILKLFDFRVGCKMFRRDEIIYPFDIICLHSVSIMSVRLPWISHPFVNFHPFFCCFFFSFFPQWNWVNVVFLELIYVACIVLNSLFAVYSLKLHS